MKIHTKRFVFAALCVAIGLLLPQVVKMIPIGNPGAILLPMHIPVLICGFVCGWRYGLVVGAILPIFAFLLTGMPPLFPIGVSMMAELATYGALTGVLYKFTKGKIWLSLIVALLGGRIVMGIVNTILFSVAESEYGLMIFLTAAFVTALPGIVIQLLLIPACVKALEKSKIILE